MHPANESESLLSVSAMTTALQELPDHSLDDLELALADERFRRRFFAEQPGGVREFFGLTSPGEALGGVGFIATWASIAAVCAFWPDEADAAEIVTSAAHGDPLDWLALTVLLSAAGYCAWRAFRAARELLAISRRAYVAPAVFGDEWEEWPAISEEEICAHIEDERRICRHSIVRAGMHVAGLQRAELAEMFPTAFPYPEI